MLPTLVLLSAFAAAQPASGAGQSYTPEQLAVGAMLEVLSAEAVHKKNYPDVGYGCSLERLVEAQLLLDVWLAGKRVDGYVFKVWCDVKSHPQATFRASAVPTKKTAGAQLTICTDESLVPRTIDSDVAACFAKGQPAR